MMKIKRKEYKQDEVFHSSTSRCRGSMFPMSEGNMHYMRT
jgi:hypothetical protein